LKKYFAESHNITADYFRFKYGSKVPRFILGAVLAKPMIDVAVPAVYGIGFKA